MRDGIAKREIELVVRDLVNGKPWDVAAKHLDGVDPAVVEANKASIEKLAAVEREERGIPQPAAPAEDDLLA